MKHGKHIQVSESFLLCALLTMTGGFLDVYTYITRGHVFANAQTGNVVLLGLNLAEGNIKEVAFYLFPIIAFALGILFTEWIRAKFKEYDLLPVSYTHLDVYKRQGLIRERVRSIMLVHSCG